MGQVYSVTKRVLLMLTKYDESMKFFVTACKIFFTIFHSLILLFPLTVDMRTVVRQDVYIWDNSDNQRKLQSLSLSSYTHCIEQNLLVTQFTFHVGKTCVCLNSRHYVKPMSKYGYKVFIRKSSDRKIMK